MFNIEIKTNPLFHYHFYQNNHTVKIMSLQVRHDLPIMPRQCRIFPCLSKCIKNLFLEYFKLNIGFKKKLLKNLHLKL